jgi:hypothetical protein
MNAPGFMTLRPHALIRSTRGEALRSREYGSLLRNVRLTTSSVSAFDSLLQPNFVTGIVLRRRLVPEGLVVGICHPLSCSHALATKTRTQRYFSASQRCHVSLGGRPDRTSDVSGGKVELEKA